MFFGALNLYRLDKEAGIEAMNYLRGPRPLNDYDKEFIRDRLRERNYLITAYFEGATPENDYEPGAPYTLNLLPDPNAQNAEEGYLKLFIPTAGADDPRPITLRQKGSGWYLWEYSSPLTGIRTPVSEDPWA